MKMRTWIILLMMLIVLGTVAAALVFALRHGLSARDEPTAIAAITR